MKIKKTFSILAIILFASCSKNEKIKYSFIGEFDYRIIDSTKFNQTVLTSDSFGYAIGDLNVQGLEIKAPKNILENKADQYIISLNSDINNAELNYECNCYPKNYYPLEITKNKLKKNNKVFIYKIEDEREFKHVLP